MSTCPSVSPKSKTPCLLPNLRSSHDQGHEGIRDKDKVKLFWGNSAEDHQRWGPKK